MPEQDEQQLAQMAQSGDRAAFDRLRCVIEPDIRRFAGRLVGNSPHLDDIVQDAFVSLYLNIDRLMPLTNLRPFLYRIVRNRCYDEMRRRGRLSTLPLHEAEERGIPLPAARSDAPDAVVQRLLMMAEVQRAVDALPEHQRQALILYAEEGLTLAEVAEAMGTEVGTIKSRIHHARRNIMRRLDSITRAALGLEKENDHGEREPPAGTYSADTARAGAAR